MKFFVRHCLGFNYIFPPRFALLFSIVIFTPRGEMCRHQWLWIWYYGDWPQLSMQQKSFEVRWKIRQMIPLW